jgi:Holliday junction DNA helicase RuvA
MIGRIQGILLEKKPPYLLIDVHGIGYELQAPMSTFYRLPDINKEVILLTHLVVREDAHILYGFSQERERTLFRNLIKVSNIGPKSALTVLSGMEPNTFVHCVMNNDTASLSRLPGIGKKTAERLVIEMRDRLSDWHDNIAIDEPLKLPEIRNAAVQDAISALIALGYKPQDARRAVLKIENQNFTREELIRQALHGIVRGAQNDNAGSID